MLQLREGDDLPLLRVSGCASALAAGDAAKGMLPLEASSSRSRRADAILRAFVYRDAAQPFSALQDP